MDKLIDKEKVKGLFADDQRLMIGGFIECGAPYRLIELLLESGVRNLTLIGNDTGFDNQKAGQLVVEKRLSRVIASHIGTNKETGRQMNSGELEVELVPQGTLVEQIRAGGAGLGGILTPTGIGTPVAEEGRIIEVEGREYLLAKPLRADLALIKAWKADSAGNLLYRHAARNFNPIMAMACDRVVVEAEEIVPAGEIDPNLVVTPGIFVDYILQNGEEE